MTHIKKIFNSTYVQNFTALAGSELIAQSIQIGVTPFLTRLYSPNVFGQYELFKSSALILVVIGFLNYETTIYSAKNETERINSIFLSVSLLSLICLVTSVLLLLFENYFVQLLKSDIKDGWYWCLPLYAFFSGLTNLMLIILTMDGSFWILSKIKVLVSILVATTQLFFGWLDLGYWGLVYSTIVVQILAFIMYFMPFYKIFWKHFSSCSFVDMKSVLINNWRIPMLVFPSNFINNFVQSLPIFFLGRIDFLVLGYFGLARRIIDFPLKFITAAVQRLYVKELMDEVNATGLGKVSFKKNLKLYSVIALVLYFGILILTKPLIPILFGEQWIPAVPYIIILGLLFIVRFVFGGLSFIMILGKAPKLDIFWQISFSTITLSVFILSPFFSLDTFEIITLYTIAGVFSYFIYGFLCYKISKSRKYLSN